MKIVKRIGEILTGEGFTVLNGLAVGVDTYASEEAVAVNGRMVNDSMGAYVADAAVRKMVEAGQAPRNSQVIILGLTFKENCSDTRNSKGADG